MRLGEFLLGEGLITKAQLQEALERQVMFGGRVGSNLVELGAIDMDSLALALGRMHERAAALQSHFKQVDLEVAERLPAEMAANWHAIALGWTDPSRSQVAVATSDPFDPRVLIELRHLFECEIVEAITPELRLFYWLERIYEIERTNRYKRISLGGAGAPPVDEGQERRGYVQTLNEIETPPDASALARVAVKRIVVPTSGVTEAVLDPNDMEKCLRAIRIATDRKKLAELVRFVLSNGFDQCLSAGMLLVVRNNTAMGWKGFVRHSSTKSVESLAVPLKSSAVFSKPIQTRGAYVGPPQSPELVDQRFWDFLGERPTEIAVLPVKVADRIPCLLYVQSDKALSPSTRESLATMTEALSASISRLLRAAKR